MTVTPKDQPAIWLKQVPKARPRDEGVWAQALLPDHQTVARSRERPRADVDAVTLQRLRVAARTAVRDRGDLHDPVFKELFDAVLDFDGQAEKERRG